MAIVNSLSILPPATSGGFNYNADPNIGGTLSVGQSYTDPVFSEDVRRLTSIGNVASEDDIYQFHVANCDGTYCFFWDASGNLDIIKLSDGSLYKNNVSSGTRRYEVRWSMTDPDKYYFRSGANLVQHIVSTGAETTIRTFGGTIGDMGGTANYQDRTDRYFTVHFSGNVNVWDSQEDAIYSNPVAFTLSGGWAAISPDGNFLIVMQSGVGKSYALNHGANSISTSPVTFFDLIGDHAALISASDGKTYAICPNNQDGTFMTPGDSPGVMAIDVTTNNAGKTSAQHIASCPRGNVLYYVQWSCSGHLSGISKGTFQDWVFGDTESSADLFDDAIVGNSNADNNDSTDNWYTNKNEIVAANVITGDVWRLAHHRSRSPDANYRHQARVSSSADGSAVLWASNMNHNPVAGYADRYMIESPLGEAEEAVVLRRLGGMQTISRGR